jgi:hypothetical protein
MSIEFTPSTRPRTHPLHRTLHQLQSQLATHQKTSVAPGSSLFHATSFKSSPTHNVTLNKSHTPQISFQNTPLSKASLRRNHLDSSKALSPPNHSTYKIIQLGPASNPEYDKNSSGTIRLPSTISSPTIETLLAQHPNAAVPGDTFSQTCHLTQGLQLDSPKMH